jgi:hypothetical protein
VRGGRKESRMSGDGHLYCLVTLRCNVSTVVCGQVGRSGIRERVSTSRFCVCIVAAQERWNPYRL